MREHEDGDNAVAFTAQCRPPVVKVSVRGRSRVVPSGEDNIMLRIKQTWKASFASSDDMWLKNKGLYLTLRVHHVIFFQGLV